MNEVRAYIADSIFTGDKFLPAHAVLVSEGKVAGLLPQNEVPDSVKPTYFHNAIIAPAFIDVQIYGASKKLFSAWPDPLSLELLVNHNRTGGTFLCLPTIATSSYDVYRSGIDAMRTYWNNGGGGVYGLHLEGPWINPVRKGAHAEQWIVRPTMDAVADLLSYGKDVIRMITLAPEVCDAAIIDYILQQGIIVSVGHSNATYGESIAAFDSGIPAVTHLFNAMSPFHHRAPGLPGATMDHSKVMASVVADGIHVDYPALRIAKQVMKERLFVITDAVTDSETGPYLHKAAGNKFESGGILSGSSLTMNQAVRNLVEKVNISMEEALRMCSLYPARLLGIDHQSGKIQEGYTASMVVLDKQSGVVDLIG
ncbi:MAG: N-acetylglucosamine-6-phosphate deacetylase [Chitinophagaceae bacterium]